MAKNPPPGSATQSLAQTVQASKPPDNWSLIDELEKELACPILSLYIGDGYMLQPNLLRSAYDVLESVGKVKKLGLFLRSLGGVTEVPWKIASLLREYGEELTVLVPEVAFSGGTHIALAGDVLVMTELATLGSVDPTRRHPLLPKDKDDNPIPASVQDLKHCIEFVKAQLGEGYGGSDVANIIAALFNHVHPFAVGAIEQSAALSRLVTRKVLATRRVSLTEEQVNKVVDMLAGEYFSHAFFISRRDVATDLGLTVTEPSPALKARMMALLTYYEEQAKEVWSGNAAGKPLKVLRSVFIESSKLRKVGYPVVNSTGEAVDFTWSSIVRGGTSAGAPIP